MSLAVSWGVCGAGCWRRQTAPYPTGSHPRAPARALGERRPSPGFRADPEGQFWRRAPPRHLAEGAALEERAAST